MKEKMVYIMNVEWNWIKQRPHFIAEGLADKYDLTVVYHYWYNRKKLQKRDTKHLKIKPVYYIPKISCYKKLRWINEAIYKFTVKRIIKKIEPKYLFVTYPEQISVIPNDFKGEIIYDCMDNHSAFIDDKSKVSHIEKMEKALLLKSNYVFMSSKNLIERLEKRYEVDSSKWTILRNAYDGEVLDVKSNKKLEKKFLKIAYLGTISSWFDWDLLTESLKIDKNLEFHLFGPVDKTNIPKVSGIVYHGIVEHNQMYMHIKEMDALIMPFVLNEITRAVDPVKLYEYINFNKEILSIYYDEIKRFDKFVHFYSDVDSFLQQVNIIRTSDKIKYTREEKEEFLNNNTWQKRVEIIKRILKE